MLTGLEGGSYLSEVKIRSIINLRNVVFGTELSHKLIFQQNQS